MTPQRRLEIEQWANRFGPANCWAGTSGTAATMIRELLAEIDRLKMELRLMESRVEELKGSELRG